MKLIGKLFWILLPATLLAATYREANPTVRRYWAFYQDRERVDDTSKDLNRLIMQLAIYYRTTHRLPGDLATFLANMPAIGMSGRTRPMDTDAWLVPYQLRDLGDRYELVSCGPDRDCANENDNLVEGAVKVNEAAPAEPGGGDKADDKMKVLFKNTEKMEKSVESYNKQLQGAP